MSRAVRFRDCTCVRKQAERSVNVSAKLRHSDAADRHNSAPLWARWQCVICRPPPSCQWNLFALSSPLIYASHCALYFAWDPFLPSLKCSLKFAILASWLALCLAGRTLLRISEPPLCVAPLFQQNETHENRQERTRIYSKTCQKYSKYLRKVTRSYSRPNKANQEESGGQMTVTVMVIIHRFCDCKIFKDTFNKKNLSTLFGHIHCAFLARSA